MDLTPRQKWLLLKIEYILAVVPLYVNNPQQLEEFRIEGEKILKELEKYETT